MANSDMYSEATFFNVIGVLITIVFGFLFLLDAMYTLFFIKKLIYKLRIIMKNSYILERACMGLPINIENRSEKYTQMREVFREEVVRSWNLRFINVLSYVLDRYNHIVYVLVCWKHRKRDKVNLLRPQFTFHIMIWTIPVFIIWLFSIFIVGTDLTISMGQAITYAFMVAILTSILSS